MLVPISTKISIEDKKRIQILINKGNFDSFSEFYRTAISRFLNELEEYQEKKKQRSLEAMGEKPAAPKKESDEEDLEELRKFVEDLY